MSVSLLFKDPFLLAKGSINTSLGFSYMRVRRAGELPPVLSLSIILIVMARTLMVLSHIGRRW